MQNHYLPAISPVMRQLWMTLAVMAMVVVTGLGLKQAGVPIPASILPGSALSANGEITTPDEAVRLAKKSSSKATDGDDDEPGSSKLIVASAAKPALVRAVVKRFSVDVNLAYAIVTHAYKESHTSGLPVSLLLGVMARESSFNPKAINNQDLGLMQVNLKYHADAIKKAGGVKAMLHPATNIHVGTQILQEYVASAGSIRKGLRRYNGFGKTNGYPDEVLAFMREFQAAARIS